jgi:uncharacterized membrane protein
MTLEKMLLFVHICGAVIGLISGFMAMLVRKGSGLHGAIGTVYYYAMLAMGSTAAVVATFYRPVLGNVVVGLLTVYLVVTAWRAGKYRDGRVGRFDVFAMLYVLGVSITAYVGGIQALGHPKFTKDGLPGVMYFMFGTFALIAVTTDFRMLRRGSLLGSYRIARHLWRMSGALLIATMSFWPGQARFLPGLRQYGAFAYIPHIFLIVSMFYWMWRVKRRKRAKQNQVLTPVQGVA